MNIYIKHIVLFSFAILCQNMNAQTNQISFFHLGDYVHQTTSISPVFIPKAKVSIGILPNLGVAFSSTTSAKELFPKVPGTNELKTDFRALYNTLDGDDQTINQLLTLNILNLAFKRKHGSISFFINAKENFQLQFKNNGLLKILGDTGFTGTANIHESAKALSYAEAGVGFTQQFLNDKLAIGARLKYISGIAHGGTEDDAIASITVNNNNTWTINTSNAIARTAGVPTDDEDFTFGKNSGFGIDLGATYEIIPNLNIELAINDIGSITWKENVKEYFLNDIKDFVFEGVDLDTDGNIGDAFLDKLEEEVGTGEREGSSYKTSLATNSYLSASYLLFNKHQFRATMFNTHSKTIDNEAVLALGYNYNLRKHTFGLAGIKDAQGDVNLGANLAVNLAFLQFYIASDNIIFNSAAEDLKDINVRLGLNLTFGYKDKDDNKRKDKRSKRYKRKKS